MHTIIISHKKQAKKLYGLHRVGVLTLRKTFCGFQLIQKCMYIGFYKSATPIQYASLRCVNVVVYGIGYTLRGDTPYSCMLQVNKVRLSFFCIRDPMSYSRKGVYIRRRSHTHATCTCVWICMICVTGYSVNARARGKGVPHTTPCYYNSYRCDMLLTMECVIRVR